jgi:TonB family protein
MKGLWDAREEPRSPPDPETDPEIDREIVSVFPERSRLLWTGIVSLLLHTGLVFLLSLGLDPAITKGGSSVYQVTIRPFLPPGGEEPDTRSTRDFRRSLPVPSNPPAKNRIQKVDHESKPEIIRREPVITKNQDPKILAASPSAKIETSVEEPKQLPQHREEEDSVREPILLPMTAVSPLGGEVDEKPNEKTIQDSGPIKIAGRGGAGWGGFGNGPGPGQGESGPGGSGEGSETGREESARGGSGGGTGKGEFRQSPGEGSGTGHGGSGKSAGSGHGTYGWGTGDGPGAGRGTPGGGGSGSGSTGVSRLGYAGNPKPIYPREARERGYQGEVLLKVEVLPNGRVGQIEVKKSSGYEVLDQSALATVKKWKFVPARRGEDAIAFWVNIPIKFELL